MYISQLEFQKYCLMFLQMFYNDHCQFLISHYLVRDNIYVFQLEFQDTD